LTGAAPVNSDYCAYHVTRLGPITIAYFGEWYNKANCWPSSRPRCRRTQRHWPCSYDTPTVRRSCYSRYWSSVSLW